MDSVLQDMHILWWIIVGFISGVLAKALTPGSNREPAGCLMTIVLGIAGSLFVGFIMRALLGVDGGGGLIGTIIGATIGAVMLLLIFRKVWDSPTPPRP